MLKTCIMQHARTHKLQMSGPTVLFILVLCWGYRVCIDWYIIYPGTEVAGINDSVGGVVGVGGLVQNFIIIVN